MRKSKYTTKELKEFLWDQIDLIIPLLGIQRDNNKYLCPYHSENTGSFSISKEKHIMKCFGCGKTIVDPYVLIRDIKGSDKEAKKFIENTFSIKIVKSKEDLVSEILDNARNGLYSEEGIEAREYLESRGVNLDAVANYPIGVLKSVFNPDLKLPARFQGAVTGLSPDSLVFGLLDTEDHSRHSSIKIRDFVKESFNNSKEFRVFPQNTKKGLFGPEITTDGIIGVIVEGEIDALATKSEFDKQGINFDVWATGGQPSKEMFKNTPFSVIYYIPDSEDKKGNEIAIQFLKSLPDTYQGDVYVFDYSKFKNIGEDPADIVANGHGKVLTDFDNYIPVEDYLYNIAGGISEDLEILKIIKGMPIRISRAFLKKADKEYLLSQAINIKDEELYIEEIKKGFLKRFQPIYVTTNKKNPELLLFYQDPEAKAKELIKVTLSDPPNITQITPYLGDITKWMLDNFPTPDFLIYGANEKEVTFMERDKRLKAIFYKVIQRIANELPKKANYEEISDGVHYINDTLVIVNGKKDTFYYDLKENKWKELTENVFGDSIILGRKEFAPGLTVHQLNNPKPLKEVYFRAKDVIKNLIILSHEWKYKIITAFVFYSIIHQVNKQKTFLWLNAEMGSGKTSLMSLLSVVNEGVLYKLIEPAEYYSNVSEASLRREVANRAIPVFMDEFEESQYKQIFDLIRQATDKGVIMRASRDSDKDVVQFKVSFCGVLSSISLSPNPADLSRVIIISMYKNRDEKKKIPVFETAVRELMSYEEYKQLSRDIFVASVNSFQEYLATKVKVEKEKIFEGLIPRSVANYVNLYTILKMVGDEFTKEELEDLKEAHLTENIEDEGMMYEIIEEYLFKIYPIRLNSGTIVSLKAIFSSPSLIEEFNMMHHPFEIDVENRELAIYYRNIQWSKIDSALNHTTVKNYLSKSPRFKRVKKSKIYLDISDMLTKIKKA